MRGIRFESLVNVWCLFGRGRVEPEAQHTMLSFFMTSESQVSGLSSQVSGLSQVPGSQVRRVCVCARASFKIQLPSQQKFYRSSAAWLVYMEMYES